MMPWPRRAGKEHPMWGKKHSKKTRQKMSNAHLGEKLSPEHRQAISNSLQGRKLSLEHRRNLSKALKGKYRGEKNHRWKGGRKRCNGYVMIWKPSHPNAQKNSYVLEHRLIMEEHLGRYLEPWEIVHHINGIRDDNRIENLELFPNQGNHLVRLGIRDLEERNLKLRRAFYGAVACWLGERRRRLELGRRL